MNHVRELDRIPDKEYRQVIADKIVIVILRVEFDGKSPGISHGFGRSFRTHNRREPDKDRCFFLWILQEFCFCMGRHALVHGKIPVGSGTFCMNHPFGNSLPVKISEFFDEVNVLQENQVALSGSKGVLVI